MRILLYGAYGFSGKLIARALLTRGIPFLVGGRDTARVSELAARLKLRARVFALEDRAQIDRGLVGVDLLLNAAGPFSETIEPLLSACLRRRVHYLDISGEVGSLEHALSRDDAARSCNVMVLPAVGFDVVPSDCLAIHLSQRYPGASHLTLGIRGSDLISHGSALTFAEHAGSWTLTRRGGVLEPMKMRTQVRWMSFSTGMRPVIAASWGDLVTAHVSTGIPNIEVYFEATAARIAALSFNQYVAWMFPRRLARDVLRSCADVVPSDPVASANTLPTAEIVGVISNGKRRVSSRLITGEAYAFTATASAHVVERILRDGATPGFQTVGKLFGSDFVLSMPGVVREELT